MHTLHLPWCAALSSAWCGHRKAGNGENSGLGWVFSQAKMKKKPQIPQQFNIKVLAKPQIPALLGTVLRGCPWCLPLTHSWGSWPPDSPLCLFCFKLYYYIFKILIFFLFNVVEHYFILFGVHFIILLHLILFLFIHGFDRIGFCFRSGLGFFFNFIGDFKFFIPFYFQLKSKPFLPSPTPCQPQNLPGGAEQHCPHCQY